MSSSCSTKGALRIHETGRSRGVPSRARDDFVDDPAIGLQESVLES
jgi:hypothetical protein